MGVFYLVTLLAVSHILIQEAICGIHWCCKSARSRTQKVSKGIWISVQWL